MSVNSPLQQFNVSSQVGLQNSCIKNLEINNYIYILYSNNHRGKKPSESLGLSCAARLLITLCLAGLVDGHNPDLQQTQAHSVIEPHILDMSTRPIGLYQQL